jgi:hypothetical protein
MNRTVVAVLVALIAVLAIGVAVGGSSKKSAPKSFVAGGSFRAVVVPTDQPRTVVVTPCNAPSSPTADMHTPGATTLRVPAGGAGLRTVLVPQCAASKGTQLNGTANTASAAFVLKPGEQPTVSPKAATTGVLARVVVPSQSAAKTIVVSPCRRTGAQREVVLKPRGATVVAPSC